MYKKIALAAVTYLRKNTLSNNGMQRGIFYNFSLAQEKSVLETLQ